MQQHECVEPELLVFGMANPSEFAVFWLITISNLVGCKTGRSAGFAPGLPPIRTLDDIQGRARSLLGQEHNPAEGGDKN
jgi:hypothetical protein